MNKRIFISIDLPREVRDYLTGLQNRDIYTIKWADTKNLHITLNFLGDLSETQIDKVKEVIGRVSQIYQPFILEMTEIIAKRDMLWATPKRNEDLIYLQSEIKNELKKERIGKSERRPYDPHILLAKTKKHGRKMRFDKIKKFNFEPFEIPVNEIGLYESKLTPGSATHILIDKFQLAEKED